MAYSTELFHYAKDRRALIAEASDLGLRGFPQMIQVISQWTGRTISAIRSEDITDGEGELVGFHYQPIADVNGPVNLDLVTILND